MEQLSNINSQQDNFQLKRFANLIIGNWYWVIGFLLFSLGVGYFIIRYESPVYVVNSTFLTKKYGGRTEESSFLRVADDPVNLLRGQTDISQEIPLLKSQGRIQATLDRLEFGISYFIQGQFKTSEVYPGDFYKVISRANSQNFPYGLKIYLDQKENGRYVLETEVENWQSHFVNKEFEFGKSYSANGWEFQIESKNAATNGNLHFFTVNNPVTLLNSYRNRLYLGWQTKGSSILIAVLNSSLPDKAIDFLNAYFNVVVEKGLEEKSQSIINTISFINDYIPQISDTLLAYQKRLDQFKLENRQLGNGSSFVLEKLNELEREKTKYIITRKYLEYLVDYIKKDKDRNVFAPPLIELESKEPLYNLFQQYLEIKWEAKTRRNEQETTKNPLINRVPDDEATFRNNILEAISNYQDINNDKIKDLNNQINFLYGSIEDLQVQSREYVELERMVTLYGNVFNSLITKRTDAFLSQASIVSDYQIVSDPTYNRRDPVSPDKRKVMIIAIMVGLGFPLGLLYVISISNNKIVSKGDLITNTTIPILGYVGHSAEYGNLAVQNAPKSLVAESFRRVRANLQYFANGDAKKVYLITSSISSEGKTFCSINLAYTYALAGKKTVIVGADMRKPTLARSFELEKHTGLSNYLSGQCELEAAIHKTDNKDLRIIPGGSIPPNPAELILTKRMKELMSYLKKNFDLIIIDTPPIGLVADAIELMEYSTLNMLIVRQNKTFKKSLEETSESYRKGELKNMLILFNDVNFQKLEYGYKSYIEGYHTYGYGYDNSYFEDGKSKRNQGFFNQLFGKK